jgi:predicted XRE-type DNA-binding protein
MKRQRFENVWDALDDDPAVAANLTMRSDLMIALRQQVESWGITQSEAARRLAITQPRLNELLRGKIENFSLDALIKLAHLAGLAVRLDIAVAA